MRWIFKLPASIKSLKNLIANEIERSEKNAQDSKQKFYTFKGVETVNTLIGDYTYVSNNSIIHNCTIGKFCSIGPNVVIGFGEHPIQFLSTSPLFYASKEGMFGEQLFTENNFEYRKPVDIGNDVWIGANVYIKNGVNIGDGAVIGAGAVVTKSIPPYAIAVGVPARILKYRFDDKTIDNLLSIKWWDWEIEKIRKNKQLFTVNSFDQIFEEETL